MNAESLSKHFGPRGDWNEGCSGYAADAALLFLLAQADHLDILRQIYETYVGLMFGVSPPVRSLLEINGYVFWLLHPDIESVRTRASRVLLSQINDAQRELKTAQELNAPMQMISPRGRTLKALKRRVGAEFWPSEISRDKHGHLHLRGERHPGPGEALRYLSVEGNQDWNSRGAYAVLSNASHPTLHTIMDLIQPGSDGRAERFGRPDTVFHYRLARMAMAGLLSTWEIVAAYRGCDRTVPRQLTAELDELPEP